MRLGVFGGTFDPPHLGHLILAAEGQYQLRLDRLLWVLTPDNPLKERQPDTSLQDRVDMLQAAIAGNRDFVFSRVDIDRPPPHYAYKTLQILREEHPQAELVYLMGADSLRDLPGWKRPRDLLSSIQILGVMRRPGFDLDLEELAEKIPSLREHVRFIDVPLLEISSTEIRRRVALGAPVGYYLPQSVYEIIRARHLYGYQNNQTI